MNCILRKWRLSDAKDLAEALNNEKILKNLRDGLPFPYTEQDALDYITAMLSADENDTFACAITINDRAVGSIGAFRQSNIHRQTAELGYYWSGELVASIGSGPVFVSCPALLGPAGIVPMDLPVKR